MSRINPYQSPEYDDDPIEPYHVDDADSVWQDGKLLVMRKGARLPNRCVKTNLPASRRRAKRTLHVPSVFKTKKVVVEIPLNRAWSIRQYGLRLLAVVLVFIGISWCGTCFIHPLHIYLGLFLCVVGIVSAVIGSILISAKRISKDFVWLKGVHPDYLAELPMWTSGESPVNQMRRG